MEEANAGVRTGMARSARLLADCSVTVALWVYYIGSFLFFFSPFYLYAFFFSRNRERSFQTMNSLLHRGFFFLLRTFVPGVAWRVSPDVRAIQSSVIIANHCSFLDPILFVSLFPRQKTIVKNTYFRVPVFGWILKTSGYVPALAGNSGSDILLDQIGGMKNFLEAGGNLFMFPEGTRSRDGRIGPFDQGAFRIAKLSGAPIKVVAIGNTGRLFPPGRSSFITRERFTISVDLVATLEPDYGDQSFSLSRYVEEARSLLEEATGK